VPRRSMTWVAALALGCSMFSCGARNDLPGVGDASGDRDATSLSAGTIFFATALTFQGESRIASMRDMGGDGYTTYAGTGDLFSSCVHTFDRNGLLLFSDDVSARVLRLDLDTGRLDEAPFPGSLASVYDVAVDADNRVYIADADGSRIIRYDRFQDGDGFAFGDTGSGVGQLSSPHGVAVRDDGKLFIADTDNARVVQIDDLVGNGWREWPMPPLLNDARPWDLAFDASGRLYVTDFANESVWRIDDIDGGGAIRLGVGGHQFSNVAVADDGRIYLSSLNGVNAIYSVADMNGTDPRTYTGPEDQPLVNPCGVAVR
jgi:sugar lactone lactonase YvrE